MAECTDLSNSVYKILIDSSRLLEYLRVNYESADLLTCSTWATNQHNLRSKRMISANLIHPHPFIATQGNMDVRNGKDRRKTNPFGKIGPWLTTGKMGGLVFTDRRKTISRRAEDGQQDQGFISAELVGC
jgi:hypothetical protein